MGNDHVGKDDAMKESWPSEDEIRNHAFEIYLARHGDEPGSDLDDWLAAEAQLTAAGEQAMRRGKSQY
jgi:Protein of unknown function (DUF2934)